MKIIGIAILLSVGLGYLTHQSTQKRNVEAAMKVIDTSNAVYPQEVASVSDHPVEVTKLYHEDKLVGIIHDEKGLETMFDSIYETEYKADFPDSKLGFIDDIFQTKELSYNIYEDRDAEIFNYIHEKNLFAIEVSKVTFSNNAVIYVQDVEDFNAAREVFIKNFISPASYELFKNREVPPALVTNGTRDLSLEVKETVKIEKSLASKDKILKDEQEILTFLNYGYEPKLETYTVKQYDTVDGVGAQNGMSGTQIASINRDIITDVDQILEVGTQLNVSKFNSPFTVTVTRELKTSEPVYPEDIEYIDDDELDVGTEVVEAVEKPGMADVTYNIVYVNGTQKDATETGRKQTVEPVRGVVKVGTKEEEVVTPGGGSQGGPGGGAAGPGGFRWPLNGGSVICGYGCYGGHRGVDLQPYEIYGPIYAIGSGVVDGGGYDAGGWGYWVRINHGNGYQSLYAHMPFPAYVGVGASVSAGENIGEVGQTGYATTPHLHLEIWDSSGSRLNACNGFIPC